MTVIACHDIATAPVATAPAPRRDFTSDPNYGASNTSEGGSYDGSIDPIYGGAPMLGSPTGTVVYPTFITVNVSGTVTQTSAALAGDGIARSPYASQDNPSMWAVMGFQSGGGIWWAVGPTATLRVVNSFFAFRNDAGGQPRGDAYHCGIGGYMLCWSWAGSAHLDFTRIHVDLTLTHAPDSTVWSGMTHSFTAGMSQTYFPNNPYPVDMSALTWRWVSDSVPSDSVACTSASGAVCSKVMIASGTMYTTAYVNGEQQQKSVHIDVRTPRLDLAASQYVLAAPGDSDTFTPSGNGVVVVQGWHFTPDSAGGPNPSRMPVSSSGVLGTRMPSVAPPTRANTSAMAPSRPSYSVAVGNSWDPCGSASPVCAHFVASSGTVEVIATVNGVQLTASAHVTVIPCPTGDDVLDSPVIRTAFKNLIQSSGPNLPPGDGIPTGSSIGNKREHAGNVYKRPDGTYYFVEDGGAVGNECTTARVPTTTPQSPADILVGMVHTHPTKKGQNVYGCPADPSGVMRKQGPWDDSTTFIARKAADSTNGGGSIADWDALTQHAGNQGPNPMVDGYVINADGEVWKLPALDAFRFSDQKRNRTVWKYAGNPTPSCNW